MKAEKINLEHFLDIKKLCKPNQMKDYESLTQELANLFGHKMKKPR